jgi:hypothetical protein
MVVRHGAGIRSGAPRAEEVCRRHIESLFLCPGTLRGIHVLGTSGAAEFGLESEATKNGVFASSIREALLEKKADFNGDTRVSVVEMRDYVGQRVFELTRGAQSEGVTAFEPDQNFDLVAPPGKRSVGLIHSTVVPDRPLERSGRDAVRTADPKREGAAESF